MPNPNSSRLLTYWPMLSNFLQVEHVHTTGQTRDLDGSEPHDLGVTTLPDTNIRKYIGPLTMIALCFNICSSWAGLSTSTQIALLQGGPVTLIYGTIIITIIYFCISLVLAELASVYPTAGGQYHFSSVLAPKRINRSVSYACGFITVFQWVSMGAAVLVITATQIMALVGYFHPGSQGHAWQLLLIYEALGVVVLIYNLFALRRIPVTHTVGCSYKLSSFALLFQCPSEADFVDA